MRIISKFRDYYDGVQGYGQDKSLVYVRNSHDVLMDGLPLKEFNEFYESLPSGSGGLLYRGIIGFCGKLYPLWYNNTDARESGFFCTLGQIETYLNDFRRCFPERFQNWGEKILFRQWDAKSTKPVKPSKWSLQYGSKNFDRKNISEAVESGGKVEAHDLFAALNAPVFVFIDKRTKDENGYKLQIEVNPCLSDYGFASVIDPYTAYQEISMYLGGVLSDINKKEPKSLSNEERRDSKGFDDMSFKTYSPGKKARRWK